jgi:AbiJ-like protein
MSIRFSERIGKRESRKTIQVDSMDSALVNSLWNVLDHHIFQPMIEERSHSISYSRFEGLFKGIWFSFLKIPTDRMPSDQFSLVNEIRKLYFSWDYLDKYDFIDFVLGCGELPMHRESFLSDLNFVLKREFSGYRIIKGVLAPITSETEIKEIEKAIENTSSQKKYRSAGIHLDTALNKLADRGSPDYRNSIKESISAIESVCKEIANNKKADLAMAIKELKKTIAVHPALEQGFLKIYGYTSDGDGIRHALTEAPSLDQEDALFMFVAASAFINYLIAKDQKVTQD